MEESPQRRSPELDFWFDRWPLGLLFLVVIVSIVTPVVTAFYYDTVETWPPLATGFSATVSKFGS